MTDPAEGWGWELSLSSSFKDSSVALLSLSQLPEPPIIWKRGRRGQTPWDSAGLVAAQQGCQSPQHRRGNPKPLPPLQTGKGQLLSSVHREPGAPSTPIRKVSLQKLGKVAQTKLGLPALHTQALWPLLSVDLSFTRTEHRERRGRMRDGNNALTLLPG